MIKWVKGPYREKRDLSQYGHISLIRDPREELMKHTMKYMRKWVERYNISMGS